ncbi:MAG: NADPH-dependent FMN reductase [Myxococcota bacterium]
MKLLGVSGSFRSGSLHTRLLDEGARMLPDGVELVRLDYRDVPLYDAEAGHPDAVGALKQAIADADGLVIACPEYNHSIPGVLKNALDWASRPAFDSVLVDKPVALFSASPGVVGGVRAQAHLREVLHGVLARVYPARELSFGSARTLFEDDRLVDPKARERLERYLVGFAEWIGLAGR